MVLLKVAWVLVSIFWFDETNDQLGFLIKALAHYNWNCKKNRYRPYTLQLFSTTATIFWTGFHKDNDFHNDFFWKIVVKIFVVCEGL